MLYLLGASLAWLCFHVFGRVKIVGLDSVPASEPLLVVANHQSYADGVLLGVVFLSRWRLHFFAKKELFQHYLARWILERWNLHPVDRKGRDIGAVRLGLELLNQGQRVGVFPEGTRSLTGALKEGELGAAYLALKAQVHILPIGITGTGYAKTNMLRIPFPCRVLTVNIGKPFSVPAIEGTPSRALLQEVRDRIMQHIAALLPEESRGMYGAEPEVS